MLIFIKSVYNEKEFNTVNFFHVTLSGSSPGIGNACIASPPACFASNLQNTSSCPYRFHRTEHDTLFAFDAFALVYFRQTISLLFDRIRRTYFDSRAGMILRASLPINRNIHK